MPQARNAAPLALLAACGGGGARPPVAVIANQPAPPPGDVAIMLDDDAPLRDCPHGMLEALAPGWGELEPTLIPQLDACLRGTLIGDSAIVYASAQPPESDQPDLAAGWVARRVIVGSDGAMIVEGPGKTGGWPFTQPALAGLVDLDGDGVHEVLEVGWDPGGLRTIDALRVDGEALVEAGGAHYWEFDQVPCGGTWSLGAPEADGRRALIVDTFFEGGSADPMAAYDAGCLPAGIYRYYLEDGQLAEPSP